MNLFILQNTYIFKINDHMLSFYKHADDISGKRKLEFILIHVVCHRGSSILFIKLEN